MNNGLKLLLVMVVAILLAGVVYGLTSDRAVNTIHAEAAPVSVPNVQPETAAKDPVKPEKTQTEQPVNNDSAPVTTAGMTEFGAAFYNLNEAGEPILRDRVLGNRDAKLQITEYASLTCPHCAHFHNNVLPELKAKYIDTGLVKMVWRPFPFDKVATKATQLAYCLPEMQFYPFLAVLFKDQDSWGRSTDAENELKKRARLAGLTEEKIDQCLKSDKLAAAILRIRLEAEKNPGVTSTPTFVIGGEKIDGARSVDVFSRLIDAQLAGSAN